MMSSEEATPLLVHRTSGEQRPAKEERTPRCCRAPKENRAPTLASPRFPKSTMNIGAAVLIWKARRGGRRGGAVVHVGHGSPIGSRIGLRTGRGSGDLRSLFPYLPPVLGSTSAPIAVSGKVRVQGQLPDPRGSGSKYLVRYIQKRRHQKLDSTPTRTPKQSSEMASKKIAPRSFAPVRTTSRQSFLWAALFSRHFYHRAQLVPPSHSQVLSWSTLIEGSRCGGTQRHIFQVSLLYEELYLLLDVKLWFLT
jgi:hypothetical protein